MENHNNNGKGILIVGDWVVDEYWFLLRHQSELSSHTGYLHYRISNTIKDTLSDLCGAGHVARVLYSIKEKNICNYELFGIGKWHIDDQDIIEHLIHSRSNEECEVAKATSKINKIPCDKSPGINLVTLNRNGPTIRVIRQYRQEGSGLEQISRVDWEPEKKDGNSNVNENQTEDYDEPEWPPVESVTAIVVYDLKKGVIDKKLIKMLYSKYSKAKWFIRSKDLNPDWLGIIKKRLTLLIIGPEVAALKNPWESWLNNGRITGQAIELLENIPGKYAGLLTDKREMIIWLKDQGSCLAIQSRLAPSVLNQLGWSSAVFGSLVHFLIAGALPKEPKKLKTIFSEIFKEADEEGGIKIPQSIAIEEKPTEDPSSTYNEWKVQHNFNDQANKDFGIIEQDNNLRLDVWRGTSFLPGYVTCVKEKQKIINRIGKSLRSFVNNHSPTRALSILLQADPGAGKTFLAKSLAKALNFKFVQCDVTQLLSLENLYNLFDNIASLQAANERLILVFVDEINAKLDGNYIYGSFLTPLEDGYYVRNGNNFTLKPCVWIFAGTNLSNSMMESGDKFSDYISRMTLIEKLDFISMKEIYKKSVGTEQLDKEARLEQVYLGATMLRRNIPDIKEVSKQVLATFYNLDPEKAPARVIRKLTEELKNVQYGKVRRENCTSDDWNALDWYKEDDGNRMVRLIY